MINMNVKKLIIKRLLRRFSAVELKEINDYIDEIWLLQIRKLQMEKVI